MKRSDEFTKYYMKKRKTVLLNHSHKKICFYKRSIIISPKKSLFIIFHLINYKFTDGINYTKGGFRTWYSTHMPHRPYCWRRAEGRDPIVQGQRGGSLSYPLRFRKTYKGQSQQPPTHSPVIFIIQTREKSVYRTSLLRV